MRKSNKVCSDDSYFDDVQDYLKDLNFPPPTSMNRLDAPEQASQFDYDLDSMTNLLAAAKKARSKDCPSMGVCKPVSGNRKPVRKHTFKQWVEEKDAQAIQAKKRKQEMKFQNIMEVADRNMLDSLEIFKQMPKGFLTPSNKNAAPKTEENEDKVKNWHARKAKEAQEKIKQQKLAEQMAREQDEDRKRRSKEAYQNWLDKISNKPKLEPPVNDEEDCLRGSFAAHHWNPNQWEYTIENEIEKR